MARRNKLGSSRGRNANPSPDQERELTLAGQYESGDEYAEEKTGITPRTMHRAKKFMLISLIFMFLCFGSIGIYNLICNTAIVDAQKSCWVNEQNIEALALKYVSDNNFSSLPAYIEDVPGYSNVFHECPTGGSYTWNPITGEFSCSEHAHWPEGFNQAMSINQGTKSVMVAVS